MRGEPGELESAESIAPAERLAEIQARLANVRAKAADLVERSRSAAESGKTARDRDGAHHFVAGLRHDLDAALTEVEGLRTALLTRGIIDQAKGMIMITLKVDADTAFDVLVKRSQQHHRKLVDVAHDVVANGIQAVDT